MNTMKPILFSGPMIRAILAGTKTQTRRVIEPQPTTMVNIGGKLLDTGAWDWRCRNRSHKCLSTTWEAVRREMLAYYDQSGELRWVQETHTITACCFDKGWRVAGYYDADQTAFDITLTEREGALFEQRKRKLATVPGRFMYRSLSRLSLEITAILVERLQSISEEDAIAEGAQQWGDNDGAFRKGFEILWDSIHARPGQRAKAIRGETHPWESSPWVWVLVFKRKEAQ